MKKISTVPLVFGILLLGVVLQAIIMLSRKGEVSSVEVKPMVTSSKKSSPKRVEQELQRIRSAAAIIPPLSEEKAVAYDRKISEWMSRAEGESPAVHVGAVPYLAGREIERQQVGEIERLAEKIKNGELTLEDGEVPDSFSSAEEAYEFIRKIREESITIH